MFKSKITTLENLLADLVAKNGELLEECSQIFAETIKSGNTIFWCGNGGSASESSHLAVELIGRFKNNRRPLPSISLSADTVALTCIANDFGFAEIFSRQLEALGRRGDLLVILSTSGNSENILQVLRTAKEKKIDSIALLGKGGGEAAKIADKAIIIDSFETARIQELHLLIGHTFCEFAEYINFNLE